VADSLSVRDCRLVTDGAAYVMMRAARAAHLAKKPAFTLGNASATWHWQISRMSDVTVTGAKESGEELLPWQAWHRPISMWGVELYDAFTINTILFLEDLRFCKKGEAAHSCPMVRLHRMDGCWATHAQSDDLRSKHRPDNGYASFHGFTRSAKASLLPSSRLVPGQYGWLAFARLNSGKAQCLDMSDEGRDSSAHV
jgi:hypothetical protein